MCLVAMDVGLRASNGLAVSFRLAVSVRVRVLCALILSETLALYKSFTYLLTF